MAPGLKMTKFYTSLGLAWGPQSFKQPRSLSKHWGVILSQWMWRFSQPHQAELDRLRDSILLGGVQRLGLIATPLSAWCGVLVSRLTLLLLLSFALRHPGGVPWRWVEPRTAQRSNLQPWASDQIYK